MSSTKKTNAQGITPATSLAAGAVAGAVEATITYPFEFAKTRSQLGSGTPGRPRIPVSKIPFSIISQTARSEGVLAIYTGCSTLILGTASKAGIRFLTFDTTKSLLADSSGKLSPGRGVVAGMLAGAIESIVAVTPTERIKTALIDDARSARSRYHGGFHAMRLILSENGIRGVYRGLVSTTIKQSSTSAVRMGSYNVLQQAVSSHKGIQNPKSPILTFAIGALAGVITVYATQPFDTIKTRAQGAKGATTIEAVRQVYRDGNILGFWRGSTMRLGRLILSGGIVFTVYEHVATQLKALTSVRGNAREDLNQIT